MKPPVFSEDYPSSFPNFREPFLILRIWRKVVVMHLGKDTCVSQCPSNRLFSKGPVQKKGERLRLLQLEARSVLLLRYPNAGDRNLRLVVQPILQPCNARQ